MKTDIRIPAWLVAPAVAAMLALLAWNLRETVELKTAVAALSTRIEMHLNGGATKIAKNP